MKTSSALLLASAVGGTFAAPASTKAGITFSATTTHTGKVRNALDDLAYAFNKYVPAEKQAAILASLPKRDTGSVATKAEPNPAGYDKLYLTEVSIGNPPQKLNLDFDTGSSDLWVFSTDTGSSYTGGQTLYKPKSSSSSSLINGESWAIHYGDGSQCSGVIYSDDVTIGGLTVKGQAVESAQKVSSQFTKDSQSSGLLGLAYSKGNTAKPTQQKTWFDNISSKLDKNLFTVRLRHGAEGSFNFGYIDSAQYTGDISYAAAYTDDLGHRLFNSDGYAVGNGETKSASMSATADTGTSLLIIPDEIADDYWSNVQSANKVQTQGGNLWVFNCSDSLPDFSFNVGSGKAVVPGDNMNYAAQGDGTCVGGISSHPGLDITIVGDVAMKSALVIYDDANNQLGWATGA
ncbi:hypothetical protein VHEMI06938 [[Torrubiella] hemipterigena]|uniref:Peptidase A1 domain-containing protein n=1 Tax=[Torrubiella] hemipterigena TaxID=1531966 RepID=A0A0A1TKD9_9HYPO|nr:hypothetical protein VHEMI06938 [[Torrubiella] hemipterigena]